MKQKHAKLTKNRVLSVLLTLVLILTLFPATAWAAPATGTAGGTQGFSTISVNLSGDSVFSADETAVTNTANWQLAVTGGSQTITNVVKTGLKTASITLSAPIASGNSFTLNASDDVFAAGFESFASPISVSITVPTPATGAATAAAGTKDISVTLTYGSFGLAANVQNTSYWTLGGSSAAGNPIAGVTLVNSTHATVTLTHNIASTDVYIITAAWPVFVNLAITSFASPLSVTVSNACAIGDTEYATLGDALAAVENGETKTITLLKDIDHKAPVVIKNKDIIFDLNNKELSIDVSHIAGREALRVEDGGTVSLLSSGGNKFDVKGHSSGVLALNDSTVIVRYAEGTSDNSTGAFAQAGSNITVLGDAKGVGSGARASGVNSIVAVGDDVMSTGDTSNAIIVDSGGHVRARSAIANGANSTGARASASSSIAVTGSVQAGKTGAYTYGAGATITVGGNVTVTAISSSGVEAGGGARVEVRGNVTAADTGVYANGCEVIVAGNVVSDNRGVHATGGGKATIGGTITAPTYIRTGTADKAETDKAPDTTKTGYDTYTDGTSTVWVKDAAGTANVCAIGSTEYDTLDAALTAAAADPDRTTIRLLQDITYNKDLIITDQIIVFDLGVFDLRVGGSASVDAGLEVENAHVSYTGNSVGGFYAKGFQRGVSVTTTSPSSSASAIVSSAEATANEGIGLWVIGPNASAVVDGPVKATDSVKGTGIFVEFGTATVNGDVSAATCGVSCSNSGKATITGDISITGATGYGVFAVGGASDAQVTVGGNVTATGAGTEGVHAEGISTVTVSGKVTATGTNGVGVDSSGTNSSEYSIVKVYNGVTGASYGVRAFTHGQVVIFGQVSVTEAFGKGVQAETQGEVTVTGNVIASNNNAVGVFAGPGVSGESFPGQVTINGNVTAYQGLQAQDGTIRVNGNVSAENYGVDVNSATVFVTGNVASAGSYGVKVGSSADVTIDGEILVTLGGNYYILLAGAERAKDSLPYEDIGGYRVYTVIYDLSVVRVGNHAVPVSTIPTVATIPVTTGITSTGATLSGNLITDGNAAVTERGFVYSTSANPTTGSGTKIVVSGSSTGVFTTALSGLSASTTYHVRAYATNSKGTGYGANESFTTLSPSTAPPSSSSSSTVGTVPTVVTDKVTGISASSATLSGEVTKKGSADVTERGFVYSKTTNPAVGGTGITKVKEGSGTGSFTSTVKGLTADTAYHVRAYAINSAGTAYGADVKFATTASTVPPAGQIGRLDASGIGSGSLYGNVVIYTDPSGEEHILGLGIIIGSDMLYVSRGAGDYKIIQNAKPFNDIAGHWAKNDIDFSSARLLFNGVTPQLFSPDTSMTRGMLVAVLGRMYGAEPASYTGHSFDDVSTGAYYAPYVKWAAENGIVFGMSETSFQPGRAVTRQEMASIMYRFMEYLKLDPKVGGGTAFTDTDQISGWAKDSTAALNATGIMTGKPGNRFDPTATSTRAETSTVLRRLVEYIVTQ